ncbi:actin-binding protein WASF3-like [Argiope bruennichi]|uniref:actin-binding protein WASF3-like n=1 Tax=Argiope bruennichi TaxID=94029 RepID=UPI002493D840|nr:actin-binding protein WASF3-like [Argiope bruennichi]XP_055935409.1 actin-binding protein WASF3-like [Argiope bruennichi]XP_055935411.1 actin-binding protein WASF3-like [Argiope bruennichi]
MPFLQRLIQPVHVCRNTLPVDNRGALAIDIPNELECVTNGTLANVIRQLSSLSKHAENIFTTLFKESTSIAARTQSLQGRIDRLAVKVTQLDSNVEEVSLQDIHMRKAFKSSIVFDQQVVSRCSMPAAMLEIYKRCGKPPPLDKLNPYREDGRDGLKFYTDPNYFFDLWKQEMLKDTEKLIHDKGKKPHRPRPDGAKRHKKVRQPHNTREKYRMMACTQDFIDKANYPQSNYSDTTQRTPSLVSDGTDGIPMRPNSLELHMPYLEQDGSYGSPANHYPPPPPAYSEYQTQAYPQQNMAQQQHYPPPPPYSVNSPDHRISSNNSTPTRQSRAGSRPSQPPPAPPVVGSNGTSTPPISAGGTPSSGAGRYRSGSHSRETLPPPPPPPDNVVNGFQPNHMAALYLTQKSVPMAANNQGSRRDTPNHHPHLMNHMSMARDHTPPPDTISMTSDSLDLPPPPPMPDAELAVAPPSPPPPPLPNSVAVLPPPPPPLPQDSAAVVTRVSDLRMQESHGVSCESTSTGSSKMSDETDSKSRSPAQGDGRSDLLAAIREGIKLRRVEDIKQKEVEKAAPLHDVASILARRVAMEFSDSDSASESEYDSEGWGEEDASEC